MDERYTIDGEYRDILGQTWEDLTAEKNIVDGHEYLVTRDDFIIYGRDDLLYFAKSEPRPDATEAESIAARYYDAVISPHYYYAKVSIDRFGLVQSNSESEALTLLADMLKVPLRAVARHMVRDHQAEKLAQTYTTVCINHNSNYLVDGDDGTRIIIKRQ